MKRTETSFTEYNNIVEILQLFLCPGKRNQNIQSEYNSAGTL